MVFIAPKVALAPMAGITDAPFRAVVARFGADLVMSEMIATHVQNHKNDQTQLRLNALGSSNVAEAVQLAGREAAAMSQSARFLSLQGVKHIDINMGCPAKKVTGGAAGAALMRDLPLAKQLIKTVRSSFDGVLSVKMRLGWDETDKNASELAYIAQEEGAQMITVHGRTRAQFYKGAAQWDQVAAVTNAVRVPVLVNGDIIDVASAQSALRHSGAHGVMVGRGVQGRPWVTAQIRAALNDDKDIQQPSLKEFVTLVCDHYRSIFSHYPVQLGVRLARKHLGWYMDQANTPKPLRQRILNSTEPQDILDQLPQALALFVQHQNPKEVV